MEPSRLAARPWRSPICRQSGIARAYQRVAPGTSAPIAVAMPSRSSVSATPRSSPSASRMPNASRWRAMASRLFEIQPPIAEPVEAERDLRRIT